MSGQCLSPSEAGHALTPATDQSLGGPLPHQLADTEQADPKAINLYSVEHIVYYPGFLQIIHDFRENSYALLTRLPSWYCYHLRLACLRHAASVHPEPGANSRKVLD